MVENHEEIVKMVKLQILHKYSVPKVLKNIFRYLGSEYHSFFSMGFPNSTWKRVVPMYGPESSEIICSADLPRDGDAATGFPFTVTLNSVL